MSVTKTKSHGFTIVELLIVIVVIAILSAISIIAYTGIQDRTRQSVIKSELSGAKKKLMMYKVDNGGYPASVGELNNADLSISSTSNYENRAGYSNFYYCVNLANNTFAIGARAAGSGVSSFYTSTNDSVTPYSGVITLHATCSSLGLAGASAADGAYATSGLTTSGASSSWLQVGS